MATYSELHALKSHNDLIEKTQVAVVIAAQDLIKTGATPTAADRAWASAVLSDPAIEASKALMFLLAANKDSTVAQIEGVTDTTVQTKVDEVVAQLVSAFSGA